MKQTELVHQELVQQSRPHYVDAKIVATHMLNLEIHDIKSALGLVFAKVMPPRSLIIVQSCRSDAS